MAKQERDWMLSGDCTEACTSPPVCPYYWGSSTPKDLHGGKNECEGAFSFDIKKGYRGGIDLSGLCAGFGFNAPEGGTASREPWKAILYIDKRADNAQAKALEEILTASWARMGQVLKVKRAVMSFVKEAIGAEAEPGYKHSVEWQGVYSLKAEPLMARNGSPRYISGMMGGIIYVGKSVENKFNDPDLSRGSWDRPGMSNTYYGFKIDPSNPRWVP